jgi:hypothetical protein
VKEGGFELLGDVGDSPAGTRDKAEGEEDSAGGMYAVHRPIANFRQSRCQ